MSRSLYWPRTARSGHGRTESLPNPGRSARPPHTGPLRRANPVNRLTEWPGLMDTIHAEATSPSPLAVTPGPDYGMTVFGGTQAAPLRRLSSRHSQLIYIASATAEQILPGDLAPANRGNSDRNLPAHSSTPSYLHPGGGSLVPSADYGDLHLKAGLCRNSQLVGNYSSVTGTGAIPTCFWRPCANYTVRQQCHHLTPNGALSASTGLAILRTNTGALATQMPG